MVLKIESQKHLEILLRVYQVPIQTWGVNATKTTNHLYDEITKGETILKEISDCNGGFGLLKRTTVARVFVVYEDRGVLYFLKESHQVFSNGSSRARTLLSSISEKIEGNEVPVQAAIRGVKEELGFDISDYIQPVEVSGYEKKIYSTSYPGLKTEKRFHDFFVSLPEKLFRSDGYAENQQDKTTYFVWEKIA